MSPSRKCIPKRRHFEITLSMYSKIDASLTTVQNFGILVAAKLKPAQQKHKIVNKRVQV